MRYCTEGSRQKLKLGDQAARAKHFCGTSVHCSPDKGTVPSNMSRPLRQLSPIRRVVADADGYGTSAGPNRAGTEKSIC
jgi:hypothetical protein